MAANYRYFCDNAKTESSSKVSVSFVGSAQPYRRYMISKLIRSGLPVKVFGRGWRADSINPSPPAWDPYKIFHDIIYYGVARLKAEGFHSSIIQPLQRKKSGEKRLDSYLRIPKKNYLGFAEWNQLPIIFLNSIVNIGISIKKWLPGTTTGETQVLLRDFEVPMSGGFYIAQYTPELERYYEVGREIEVWSSLEELIEKVNYYLDHASEREAIRRAGMLRARSDHTWQKRFIKLFGTLS